MGNLALIPARGGSKRIPGKNIKDFLGKPVIAYSIEAALKSGLFDEVMVSTDNDEIAEIAQKYGAKVPFKRSEKNADDFATTADVISEVLTKYEKRFEYACCIYPAAPFVTSEKLKNTLKLMESKQLDSVFPVVAFSFPVQRALKITDGKLHFFHPEFALSRSQDLEKAYHDTGQFYWFNVSVFRKEGKIVTGNCGAIVVSELEVQDIDNETDWKLAELKYQLLK